MNFIFKEIDKLRNGEAINTVGMLSNRYTVYCKEKDGTKTAYCFGVPIRNIKSNNIVNLRFFHGKQGSTFVGSEARVSITDKIRLLNQYVMCDIVINGDLSKKTEQAVFFPLINNV